MIYERAQASNRRQMAIRSHRTGLAVWREEGGAGPSGNYKYLVGLGQAQGFRPRVVSAGSVGQRRSPVDAQKLI